MHGSFLFPFSYGFTTRVQRKEDKLSFAIIFLAPIFFLTYKQIPSILAFFLALIAEYSLYEIGYLCNDCFTTLQETNPNYRISHGRQEAARMSIKPLIVSRLIYSAVSLVLLFAFVEHEHIFRFLAALAMLSFCFALHNSVRSRANILTYLLLCSVKYISIPVLFLELSEIPKAFFSLFFSFILPRSFEHSMKPKYALWPRLSLSNELLRVVYYSVLLIISGIYAALSRHISSVFLLGIWFFSFRLLAFWYSKFAL